MTLTALVTGGSGGIGSAICKTLAGDWNVAIHYHNDESAAQDVATTVETGESTAGTYQANVADPEASKGLVDAVVDDFGQLDAIVNNAGVFYDASLEEYDSKMYNRTFGVNVDGAIHCTQAALEKMRDNDPVDGVRGRIIGVTSTAGVHGAPKDAVYAASKGALVAFIKSVARANAQDGVLANLVAPGPTNTEMLSTKRKELAAEAIPLGRISQPEEVAEMVREVLESTYVTGQVIEVNGGLYT